MKIFKYLFILLIVSNGYNPILAQIPTLENHHIWIQPSTNFHPIQRVKFQSLTDSTILYIKRNELYETPLVNIANLYIREKGKSGKAALKGAGIGLLSGIIIALVDGTPSENGLLCGLNQQKKVQLYGITGFIMGTSIGFSFGNSRKKIPINPKRRNRRFEKQLNIQR